MTQSVVYEIHDPASGSLVQVTEDRVVAEKYFEKNYYVVENKQKSFNYPPKSL